MRDWTNYVFLICFIALFSACGGEYEEKCEVIPDISNIDAQIEFEHLGEVLVNGKSREEIQAFARKYPVIADYFLKRKQYPEEALFVNTLYKRFNNVHIDSLLQETKNVFGDYQELEAAFQEAFSNFKYYYPNFKIPKIQTIVTGFETDMYISDSLIIVGLDYYLGENSKYRPTNMFAYLRKKYQKEYIVPSCMLLYGINTNFNAQKPSDKTILADMMTYGKAFYFAKRMVPCTPDSIIIWYTDEEIKGIRKNQDVVWSHFVENELLYDTNHELKRKYIDERPKTYEIGPKCPGRAGMWLGWEIVKTYMRKNPEVTLPDLMRIADPREIFNKANYKPDR
ncbi:MAG: gliding motility lipoprotein GldB [Bacteroidota bacterium]